MTTDNKKPEIIRGQPLPRQPFVFVKDKTDEADESSINSMENEKAAPEMLASPKKTEDLPTTAAAKDSEASQHLSAPEAIQTSAEESESDSSQFKTPLGQSQLGKSGVAKKGPSIVIATPTITQAQTEPDTQLAKSTEVIEEEEITRHESPLNQAEEAVTKEESIDIHAPQYYFNRELSHLQFNHRVLEQALDTSHPLLERLKFLCIFSSNMDEFFEVRVAALKEKIALGENSTGPDAMLPEAQLKAIHQVCHKNIERQYKILNEILIPELEEQNIRFYRRHYWTKEISQWAKQYFIDHILPVVSPICLDPSHPFPILVNKSLNFIVSLDGKDAFGRQTGLAIIPAPRTLPRLIRIPSEICPKGDNFIFLSSLIHQHADELFPGMTIQGCYQFRLTRDADLDLDEDHGDLAHALRGELYQRHFGDAVRLEVVNYMPESLQQVLLTQFGLTKQDLYPVNGPVNLNRLMSVVSQTDRPDLCYKPYSPGLPKSLRNSKKSIFEAIRQEDILIHHPFQSFSPVVDFLKQAGKDPDVIAIKQTLYRTGVNSSIVNSLVDAARNGKEVTVIIELRARFDEAENLELASRLQSAGIVVVYGVVGYKTHAKMVLVVRRENNRLVRYVHLGTGNYHATNARFYTDYSFLSCDEQLGEDVHNVFQQLTGMGKARKVHKAFHAPFTLHKSILRLIQQESDNAKKGKPAHIIIKVNGLTEPKLIQALYRASQAGVKVDLVVRGMCCLKPGIPGVSENIQVRSIIGQFLEHTRVYYFHNNGEYLIYCSSADGMERNLINRVELAFPIQAPKLVKRIRKELDFYLSDNIQSWILQEDGDYKRSVPEKDDEPVSAQQELLQSLSTILN